MLARENGFHGVSESAFAKPLGSIRTAPVDARNVPLLPNFARRDRLMLWVDAPRSCRRGIRLNASIAQLVREALAVAKEIIPVGMEAAAIMVAAREC